MKRNALVAAVLLTGAANAAQTALPDRLAIVVDPKAPDATFFAADELKRCLEHRFGGHTVPIAKEPSTGGFSIVLGTNRWSAAAGVHPESLARDGFVVRSAPGRLYIAGCDTPGFPLRQQLKAGFRAAGECATAFGVYDFLERYANCRFFFPGELGECIPRGDDLVVGPIDYVSVPDFSVRRIYNGHAKFIEADRGGLGKSLMMLRMETRTIPCCHGLNGFMYLKRFGSSHPEYFALSGGIRQVNPNEKHAGQLCWSSGVMEEVYRDVRSYLTGEGPEVRGIPAKHGKGLAWNYNCSERRYVDVMPQDSLTPCQCDRCRAAWAAGPKNSPATELVWGRVAEWARRLKAEGIAGDLTMMSYHPYMNVPSVELPDNVQVMVAVMGPFAMNNPEKITEDDARIRDWTKKLGHKVWLWTYPNKYGSREIAGVPNFSMRAWGEFYRTRRDLIFGAFAECEADRWFYNHLNQYVFGRVMWNNAEDPDRLVRDYLERMFGGGEASARMAEVVNGLEERWMKRVMGRFVDTPLGPQCSTPGDEELWTKIYGRDYVASIDANLKAARAAIPADAPDRALILARIDLYEREILVPLRKTSDAYNDHRAAVAAEPHLKANTPITLRPYVGVGIGAFGDKTPTTIERDIACTATMWRTEKDLCVRFVCSEPRMDDICAVTRPHDDPYLWQDNSVEFFFSPTGKRSSGYHVIINSEGSIADFRRYSVGQSNNEDKSWNPRIRHEIRKNRDGWTCEIAVPLDEIEPIAAEMPVNFCRCRVLKTPGKEHKFFISSPHARNFGDSNSFSIIEL